CLPRNLIINQFFCCLIEFFTLLWLRNCLLLNGFTNWFLLHNTLIKSKSNIQLSLQFIIRFELIRSNQALKRIFLLPDFLEFLKIADKQWRWCIKTRLLIVWYCYLITCT